jgi:rare lipoprotein A
MPAAAILTLLLLLLASCAESPPASPPPESRYADLHDFAPPQSIAPHEVVDATPRPDPILAAGNKSPYKVNGVTYNILEEYRNYREQGIASWYGAKFNGHETSNGEIYDLYQASAAHKTLPIPSYARVTNLDNGNSIVVRVNDRGPFHADRLIDLSYAAAVKLDYMDSGTARVEVAVIDVTGVDDRRNATSGSYRFLQLGAFSAEGSAERLQDELQPLVSAPVSVSQVEAGGARLYRVRVGPVQDNDHLLSVQQQLLEGGYDVGQPLP